MPENNNSNPSLISFRRHFPKIAALIIGLAVIGLVAANWQMIERITGIHTSKRAASAPIVTGIDEIKLDRPDAFIESEHLADLPKDLLKVPLLRDTLTEDFVFYYESNADRLGLAGSLRRIAYEHQLEWQDSLISDLLNHPSELALWRSLDGKLTFGLLRIKIDGLASFSQFITQAMASLSSFAADDSQLTKAADITIDKASVTFYRLRYLGQKSIAFAFHNGYLLVASTPELLLSGNEGSAQLSSQAASQMTTFFASRKLYWDSFNLKERATKHRVSIQMSHLSMGYQAFLANVSAVRFEFNNDEWKSFLGVQQGATENAFAFSPLWQAIPADASLCVAVPVSSARIGEVIQRYAPNKPELVSVATAMGQSMSACWFSQSHLLTPLLVAELPPNASQTDMNPLLENLFSSVIGNYEAGTAEGHYPVEKHDEAAGPVWSRVVSSRFGIYSADEAKVTPSSRAQAFFKVTFAHHKNLLFFSMDDQLVQHAIDAASKRYPVLAEKIPANTLATLYASPSQLAPLLESESMASLSSDFQEVFRNAAEKNLLPKIRAMKKYPDFITVLPQQFHADEPLEWISLQWKNL